MDRTAPLDPVDAQDLTILSCWALGESHSQIARRVGISRSAVAGRLARIRVDDARAHNDVSPIRIGRQ
jgi:hypothetical protein